MAGTAKLTKFGKWQNWYSWSTQPIEAVVTISQCIMHPTKHLYDTADVEVIDWFLLLDSILPQQANKHVFIPGNNQTVKLKQWRIKNIRLQNDFAGCPLFQVFRFFNYYFAT